MEVLPKKTLTSPRGVTVSGDGRFFLVLEDQFEVRSAETREIVKSLDYHDWPASEAFSPDGSLLAVGHHKGEVAVWETATWKRRYTFPTGRGPIVRFSPDSKTLASIDSAFRFWDMQTGKRMDRTFGHEEAIAELAFSPGGERLASIGFDRTLRIWDPKTGKQVRVQDVTCPPQFYTAEPNKEVAATRYPKSFAWSPDGAAMAVGMQLHDAKDGRLIRRFLDEKSTGYADFAPVNVALSFDGKFTNVNQQEIRRWETSSGKLLDRTAPQDGFLFEGKAVAAPDGSRTVSMGFDRSAKAAIVVSDLAANRQAIALQIPEFSRGGFMTPDVYDLAASPDSKRAAFGLFSIHVFDLADPGRSQTFGESTHAIGSLAFAPHGNALAAGRDDGTVEFWDLSTRRQIAKFSTGQGLVKALAFSPDGRLIASGGADSTVLLWPLRDLLSGAAAPADVATLWIDLNQNADIPRAYRSIERLAARPAESMPIFREKLKPRTPVPAARLTSLFADLAGEDFARREKATRDLTALGDVIVRDLVKLRKESASAEVARRVSGILDRFADRRPTEGFAVQTLEAIDNADAVRLLEELASGVPGAGLTLEAQAALARRDRRLKAIQ
jgi:WD40 repeat protein